MSQGKTTEFAGKEPAINSQEAENAEKLAAAFDGLNVQTDANGVVANEAIQTPAAEEKIELAKKKDKKKNSIMKALTPFK